MFGAKERGKIIIVKSKCCTKRYATSGAPCHQQHTKRYSMAQTLYDTLSLASDNQAGKIEKHVTRSPSCTENVFLVRVYAVKRTTMCWIYYRLHRIHLVPACERFPKEKPPGLQQGFRVIKIYQTSVKSPETTASLYIEVSTLTCSTTGKCDGSTECCKRAFFFSVQFVTQSVY